MTEQDHDHFMDVALEESRKAGEAGNKAVGAVIVKEGAIVGRGHNTVDSEGDPTNHAETVAIRDACRSLGTTALGGCTLYSAMEPCPMCLWAIHLAGIERLVLGGRHAAMGRTDLGAYSVETLMAMTAQSIDLVTGVRERECEDLRQEWDARRADAER